MESESSTTLVLCGKSAAEDEFARRLKTNNALKLPDGSPVSVCLHSETESAGNDGVFRVNSYMNSISTSRFGRLLVYSPRLASTHDVVANNFGELPIGSVCVADVQFKGRGRSKNVWESPKGCLLFSFTIQMEDGRVVPLVQYVVCLAMTEAVNDVCRRNGMPSLDVRIKWPNDLYLDGLKVGGILCTSTYRSKKFNVSAGIGLNIDNQRPTTCLNAVLQRLGYAANQLQREDIIAAFFNKFEVFHDIFLSQGFQALENLYYKTWLHSGQRVILQEKSESEDQVSENVVTIQGLTPSGYLLAATDDGQICELHPDGNSCPLTILLLVNGKRRTMPHSTPPQFTFLIPTEASPAVAIICPSQVLNAVLCYVIRCLSISFKDWSEGNWLEQASIPTLNPKRKEAITM